MPAGYFDVVKLRKQYVGDIINGNAAIGDQCVSGGFSKRPGKVKDVFDGGWLRVDVVCGWNKWETVGCENVDVM